MTERLEPFYNPGPGDIIKDAMDERGWNNEDLAKNIGLSLEDIDLILNNERAITPEIAELLGKTFSTSAEMWLNLNEKYRKRNTKQSELNTEILHSKEMIIHPGETLKEVIEDRNISVETLAQSAGFPQDYIRGVISCKENISDEFAKKLEDILNIDADFWLKLNDLYNEELKASEKSHLAYKKH